MNTSKDYFEKIKLELDNIGGICIYCDSYDNLNYANEIINEWVTHENLNVYIQTKLLLMDNIKTIHLSPTRALCDITPFHNTLNLQNIGCTIENEIVLAMTRCPVTYFFPSYEELFSSLRIRRNASIAAQKTQITFETEAALRPKEYWTYIENSGFILNTNKSLIEALTKTIHPTDDQLFSFACSRACEHVMLLALTQELELTNPELLHNLEILWQKKALLNTDFDNAFMQEHGSFENPLPIHFFVPGDRVWFCNPHEYSTNVTGFEGSWVIYLGGGRFSNFWNFKDPTLYELKCLEMFHWRHGVEFNSEGEFWMNEPYVAEQVKKSSLDLETRQNIITQMMKQYDEESYYKNGGFVPPYREHIRLVCQTTSNILI